MNFTLTIPEKASKVRPSGRLSEVAIHFGLHETASNSPLLGPVQVDLQPGRILAVVGPSGCGKSSLLAALHQLYPKSLLVQQTQTPAEQAILDAMSPVGGMNEALALLTSCGVGEPRLWIRAMDELSDGERFRARLAVAIQQRIQDGSTDPLLCDEFCSGLHHRAATAVACNLRKLVSRHQLSVVVAMSNDDVLGALLADEVLRLDGLGGGEIKADPSPAVGFDWIGQLTIEPGGKRDYDAFATMHYRPTEELGFVDCIFVMREKQSRDALGIVVYSHPPLELRLRNQATGGLFKRNPHRLNRDMRILRRLVIHPDVRGCGLGHHLVRQTLHQVGTPFVECLAGMGLLNPVFEKAGMQRIGQCAVTESQRSALRQVQNFGLDPMAREFVNAVCRRPRVRRVVTQFVGQWYQATTSTGDSRVARQSPEFLARTFQSLIGSRPVYYLWNRDGERFELASGG